MKLRYFYQQMIAFFTVIATLLIILAIVFLQFAKKSVYQETEDQLYGYAEALIASNLQENQLKEATFILKNQNVGITVFNEQNRMTFPKTNTPYKSDLSSEYYKKLANGERLSLSFRDTDFMGNPVEIALVYLPFFSQADSSFEGFIGVSAPISYLNANLAALRKNLFIAFICSMIGAIVIGFIFAKYQVGRINRLRNATHKVAKGNFDINLENRERDEFDELAEDFNSMAQSLEASQKEIERQEERRRQFMADAAHEMRTPLTTVNGLLEGLEHDMIPENQKKRSIQLMQNETKRLIRLVNENLDYEKIRSNQIYLNKQTFNAKKALEMITEQLHEKAESSRDQLTLDCPDDVVVYADYDRFMQIMVNILQNAIQFTTDGQIHIRGRQETDASVFELSDNGIGMSEEQVRNIWERYYKADVSRKSTKYGESGLGLAIVHQLVQLHQGKIEVESELGKGSTFTLTFPAKKQETEHN
ncbi:sensor histidine kinase [Pisciglobus halotolerans]|uniref:histidine kinase n=1 Tax=Pisciglobus halotolerans TaxID=745365 RepID=A0A1I3C5U6_9LACT|nr:sensor histidine kinase [Pisciglobus halotolerans]SFH69529.1 His Kinase A (phospho-acceptor) domain-containing protein [Pisciglobus halotolerans]